MPYLPAGVEQDGEAYPVDITDIDTSLEQTLSGSDGTIGPPPSHTQVE